MRLLRIRKLLVSMDWASFVPLAAAVALLGWQLASAPIIGLADNGDFGWLTAPFGLEPRGATRDDHYYDFVVRTWDLQPKHLPQFLCSSLLFVPLALGLNAMRSSGAFDLVLLGAAYSLVFLSGLFVLARSLRLAGWNGWMRSALLLGAVFVLCDTGHVAQYNSFYMTAAAHALSPWLVGIPCLILADGRPTPARVTGFAVVSCLFIWSKPQLALVGFVIAFALLGLIRLGMATGSGRRPVLVAAAVVGLASLALLAYPRTSGALRQSIYRVNAYHAVFTGLLEVSNDPEADLAALGVAPELARFAGVSCLDPAGPDVNTGEWRSFYRSVGMGKLALFYLTHPSALYRLMQQASKSAFPLPGFGVGMYEKHAEAATKSFASWSHVRHRLASSVWSVSAPMVLVIAIAALARFRLKSPRGRWGAELLGCLALLALLQLFLVPIVSGLPAIGRHLYPYALLFDWSLLCVLALAMGTSRSHPTGAAAPD